MNEFYNQAARQRSPEDLALFLKRHTFCQTFTGNLTVHFRPIHPDDAAALDEFFRSHSEQTILHRYLAHIHYLSAKQIQKFVTVDYENEFALVGLLRNGASERMICVGRFCRGATSDEAEVAAVVHDELQGRGIGTCLVKRLMEIAAENGIRVFTASVLADNQAMMHIFHKLASKMEVRLDSEIYEVRFHIR